MRNIKSVLKLLRWRLKKGRQKLDNAVDYKRFESLIKQSKTNIKTWSLKKDWLQFAINYHDSKHVTLRHARRLHGFFKKN